MSLLGERLYEEALDVFMEGLVIAERQRLGDRVLSTFHDHVAHTILQLRQQRAVHNFNLVSFACCHTHLTSGACQHPEDAAAVLHTALFTHTSATICQSALTGRIAFAARLTACAASSSRSASLSSRQDA